MPPGVIEGSLRATVRIHPSSFSQLVEGLDAIFQRPYGCFEQTSTSNYPNLLILDYLKESDQAQPDVQRRARDLLANGYQKLVSFECRDPGQNRQQGYEWFGGTAPPHEVTMGSR